MSQASRFVVGAGVEGRLGGGCVDSTQARNRKYWPDGTFANSFNFPLCSRALLLDSRKRPEPEISRMCESLYLPQDQPPQHQF